MERRDDSQTFSDQKVPPRRHAITVDVEEYYHATNLERVIGPNQWHSLPSRVDAATRELLEVFAQNGARGTFFVLGCVARRWPALVRAIADAGHEVASHGYAHRLVYDQTPRTFSRDIRKSKFLLEDLIGQAVDGYRAPNFSILKEQDWAYDEILAAGYRYDSSLHPIRHPRYGNRHGSTSPFALERTEGHLVIIPLTVCEVALGPKSVRLPVAGGAYWRHFPKNYIRWGLSRAAAEQSLNCYLHPWEIDPEQPVFDTLPLLTRLRHYGGISNLQQNLRDYLKGFHFVPIREAFDSYLQNP